MLLKHPNPYREGLPETLKLDWADFEFALSARNSAALGHEAEWAVVNYMAADCDLAVQLFDDLHEMKGIGSSDRLHLCAWFNGPLITDAFFARLNRDTTLDEDLALRFGDLPFNESRTLSMALTVAAAYPARKRVLLLSGHGGGWRGALREDDHSGLYRDNPSRMKLPAPFQACVKHLQACAAIAQEQINRVFDGTPTGRRADILAFDACDMGCIEAITAFANHGDILVVSQDQVPGDGYPYAQVLSALNERLEQTPLELARALVAQTKRRYAQAQDAGLSITQVALRSTELQGFVEAFVALIGTLTPTDRVRDALIHAFGNVKTFEAQGNIDLIGFVRLLREAPLPDDARRTSHEVLVRWERMVLASAVPGGARALNGLSIHAPQPGHIKLAYLQLMETQPWGLSAWGRFLSGYHLELLT